MHQLSKIIISFPNCGKTSFCSLNKNKFNGYDLIDSSPKAFCGGYRDFDHFFLQKFKDEYSIFMKYPRLYDCFKEWGMNLDYEEKQTFINEVMIDFTKGNHNYCMITNFAFNDFLKSSAEIVAVIPPKKILARNIQARFQSGIKARRIFLRNGKDHETELLKYCKQNNIKIKKNYEACF